MNNNPHEMGRPCIHTVGAMTRAIRFEDGSAWPEGIGGKHIGATSWLDLWKASISDCDGSSGGVLEESAHS
jgi:hypothetical protein